MKLRWSAHSLRELEAIIEYIAADNPTAALELGEQILSSVDAVLPANPYAGRPSRAEGMHELVVHDSHNSPLIQASEFVALSAANRPLLFFLVHRSRPQAHCRIRR